MPLNKNKRKEKSGCRTQGKFRLSKDDLITDAQEQQPYFLRGLRNRSGRRTREPPAPQRALHHWLLSHCTLQNSPFIRSAGMRLAGLSKSSTIPSIDSNAVSSRLPVSRAADLASSESRLNQLRKVKMRFAPAPSVFATVVFPA